ncbi:MAG: glutathione S-transferase [Shimia sp.]
MELIYSPASPFVRMARVTAIEVGLADQIKMTEVSTNAYAQAPEILAANPLGKIPALVRNDGVTLYDSRVICRYLNDISGANLYAATRLWEVLTLEATGQGIADVTVAMVYEVRMREEAQRSDRWIEAQWGKAAKALNALEARWMAHMAGPLDAGQIAVACALGYIDLRHDARGWREGRPALAAWYEKVAERASMQATAVSA